MAYKEKFVRGTLLYPTAENGQANFDQLRWDSKFGKIKGAG
jgi:hypothetical protein